MQSTKPHWFPVLLLSLVTGTVGGFKVAECVVQPVITMPPEGLRYQPLGLGKLQVRGTYFELREFLQRYNEALDSDWKERDDVVAKFEEVSNVAKANGALLLSITSSKERKAVLDAIR